MIWLTILSALVVTGFATLQLVRMSNKSSAIDCAWCGVVMQAGRRPVTHSICEECSAACECSNPDCSLCRAEENALYDDLDLEPEIVGDAEWEVSRGLHGKAVL